MENRCIFFLLFADGMVCLTNQHLDRLFESSCGVLLSSNAASLREEFAVQFEGENGMVSMFLMNRLTVFLPHDDFLFK